MATTNERKKIIWLKNSKSRCTRVSGGFIHDRRLDRQGLMIVINKKKHSLISGCIYVYTMYIYIYMLEDFRANK